jgi:hypothetical protein
VYAATVLHTLDNSSSGRVLAVIRFTTGSWREMANRCSRGDNVVAFVVDDLTVAHARITEYSQGRRIFSAVSKEEFNRRWDVTLRDVTADEVPIGATLVSDPPEVGGAGDKGGE